MAYLQTNEETRQYVLPPVRCTETERDRIRQNAAAAKLATSTYMREMALNGRVVFKHSQVDVGLVFQLQRVGVNLNQITKTLHRSSALPSELPVVIAKLEALLDELMHK